MMECNELENVINVFKTGKADSKGAGVRINNENLVSFSAAGLPASICFLSRKKKMPPRAEDEQKGKVYQRIGCHLGPTFWTCCNV